MLRTALAILVFPFPAALFQAIVVALWPKEGLGVFERPFSMFVVVCIYFYVFGLVVGGPAWLLIRPRNASWQTYAVIGFLVGLLPAGAALGWTIIQSQMSLYVIAYNLAFFGLGGVAAGWVFWRVSRRTARSPAGCNVGNTL